MTTTIPGYERDAYLTVLETEVVVVRPSGGSGDSSTGAEVLLADTILYPEGGGQPSDRGTINGVPVLDVRRTPEGIIHFLADSLPLGATIVPLGAATVRVDWERRYDHMQQHTGQHLLTAVAEERFSWSTTAFHLGAEVSDIDLAVPRLTGGDLRLLEEAVAEEVRRARPVRSRRVSPEEYAAARVRTRGLPEDHRGEIRLVEIEDVDLNTCGGTHLRSTAEIETLALLGTESMRGGTRVFFVAGRRVRARMAEHEARNTVLRTALGAPDDQLGEAARSRIAALEQSMRSVRRLEEQLAELHADLLASQVASAASGFVEAHFEDRDGGFLQRCARRFASVSPDGIAFLTASGSGGGVFVIAAGDRRTAAAKSLGPRVAEMLGGRGGGAGAVFQGKVESLARREEVVAWIRDHGEE